MCNKLPDVTDPIAPAHATNANNTQLKATPLTVNLLRCNLKSSFFNLAGRNARKRLNLQHCTCTITEMRRHNLPNTIVKTAFYNE